MAGFSDAEDFQKRMITIQGEDGGSARISPYGAQALSWITADGAEQLFLSPRSVYRAGTAIRGGVPVIFPQFAGQGNLPKHGFARVTGWEVERIARSQASLRLTDTEQTREIWPYGYLVEINFRVASNGFEIGFAVTNTGETEFNFTCALHTYLRVGNLREAVVSGLNGLIYRDSADQGIEKQEKSERVVFEGEVDRIYLNTPRRLLLIDGERQLQVNQQGFPDTVVWNPGADKCAALTDMEPDGYLRFVCIEAAAAGEPLRLQAGETWRGSQSLLR